MSMRVVSDSDVIVEAGLAVQLGYYGDFNRYFTHAVVLGYDPLLAELKKGYFYLPIGVRRLSSILRLNVESVYREEFLSDPVDAYEYDWGYDRMTYATALSGLGLFIDTLSGVNHRIPPYRKNERNCRHTTTGGTVYPQSLDIPHRKVFYSFAGNYIPVRYNDGNTYYNASVTSLVPFAANPYPVGFGSYFAHNLLDFLEGLREGVTIHRFDHGYQIVRLTNLAYTVDCGSFVITYKMEVETFPSLANNYNDDHAWWDTTIKFPMELQSSDFRNPVVGGSYGTSRYQSASYSFSDFRSHYGGGSPEYGPISYTCSSVGEDRCFPIILSLPVGEGDVFSSAQIQTWIKSPKANFANSVKLQWRHITPAALFSTTDAVKNMEHSLNVNILQNLQKLPDIASMMPAFQDAVRVLSRFAKRDLSLATLKDIADLLSQTELQKSFQWRPSLEVLTTYLPQLLSIVGSLASQPVTSVGYGKYSFTFREGTFGRAESRLLVRTKLVVDISPRGLLSTLLGHDALGTLPKVSNLWDLVPFSFAVNWFTGIGASVRRAEYSVALLTLPAYYVHTYLITSPFTESQMNEYGYSSSISNPAHLRLYWRDISHFPPPVSDSKFGFGIPTQLPNMGTAAALFWQLFFAAK